MSSERKMRSGNVWRVLGLCLLSVGAWGQTENEDIDGLAEKLYKVSISGTKVVLTCPEDEYREINWKKNGVTLPSRDFSLEIDPFSEMEHSGHYSCSSSNKYLYLKARVCENCIEVNLMTVAVIIMADTCVTLGLLLLVYYWSKRSKAKGKPVTRGAGGRPSGQSKERPPPVPNPDYEPIRKGQRDLYSGLNQRGI